MADFFPLSVDDECEEYLAACFFDVTVVDVQLGPDDGGPCRAITFFLSDGREVLLGSPDGGIVIAEAGLGEA